MSQPARLPALAIALSLALSLTLTACAHREVTFAPGTTVVDKAEADRIALSADLRDSASLKGEDAVSARTEALVALRKQGKEAGGVADLLTRVFPSDTKAVPLLVRGVTMNGTPAWLVVEAWAERTGALSHRRVWVLSRSAGDVLYYRAWR
jgi:hypothetical protein